MKYLIKEKWRIYGCIELYENERIGLKAVKKYIKDWLESWQENAEDTDGKYICEETDYKTFARCRIRYNNSNSILAFGFGKYRYDTFSLRVRRAK